MEKFRSFHYVIEASFLFLCIENVITVYNKHLATLRTEQVTFSKKKKNNGEIIIGEAESSELQVTRGANLDDGNKNP